MTKKRKFRKHTEKRTLTPYEHSCYGNMKVNARVFDKERFPSWNAVQECEGENCAAASVCAYFQQTPNPGNTNSRKCNVVMRYLKEVEHVILSSFGKGLTDADLFRVGMHLLPLYKQLARLKITEMTISSNSVSEMTKGGTTKIHGLFKEMRECIKAIDACWREIGFTKRENESVPQSVNMSASSSYYEDMEKDALKEQKSLKLVRKNDASG